MFKRFFLSFFIVFILTMGATNFIRWQNRPVLALSNEASPYGININISINEEPNPSLAERRRVYRLLREAGVEWVRDSGAPGPRGFTSWARVEPHKGQWDWVEADKNINFLKEYGFSILGFLGRPPYWARLKGDVSEIVHPISLDDYEVYVEQVVGHYGFGPGGKRQIHYWEVGNEPNNNEFYRNDPQKYLDLLKVAYATVKRIDPSAQVVLGGLGGEGLNDNNRFEDYIFNHGAKNYFDIFNFHAYGWTPADSRGEYGFVATINIAKELAQTYGFTDKPIWLTETGSNSSPGLDSQSSDHLMAQQATDLRGRYYLALNTHHLDKVFWFRYKDTGADNWWGTFGILDINLNPKPSYYAYQVTAGGPLPTPVPQPTPTSAPTSSPSFNLTSGWNQITWPHVSGKKASDIPTECPIAVAKENFWFRPYVRDFGGVNFNFEKDKAYFIKCNQETVWQL